MSKYTHSSSHDYNGARLIHMNAVTRLIQN